MSEPKTLAEVHAEIDRLVDASSLQYPDIAREILKKYARVPPSREVVIAEARAYLISQGIDPDGH